MRSLFYILVILTLTGCSMPSVHPRALDDAQRLMHTEPAAALTKLNGVDVSEFQDSAMMARWALLYSEAMVINCLAAPTDTIVNIAIDYYGRHNLTDEFQKASRLKALIKATNNSDELATALYLQKEKEFFLYKERARHERNMFIVLAILLIACGTIIWMRQRLKLQSARNDAMIAEATNLRNQMETKLRGMLEKRFALIDSLCQTYYESQGTPLERKAITEKVKKEIKAVKSDSFSEMEQAVNDCRDNLLVKVRECFPAIKTDDYQLLVFLAGGLSTRAISLLLGESTDVVYKRKSRLKSRLKAHVEASVPSILSIF